MKSFTGYMGTAAIPMSMMLIGASIAQANLKELLGEAKIYAFLAISCLSFAMTAALVIEFCATCGAGGNFVFMPLKCRWAASCSRWRRNTGRMKPAVPGERC